MVWCDDYMGNIWTLVDKSDYPTFCFRGEGVEEIYTRCDMGAWQLWCRVVVDSIGEKNRTIFHFYDEHMQTRTTKVKKNENIKGPNIYFPKGPRNFCQAPVGASKLQLLQWHTFFVRYFVFQNEKKKLKTFFSCKNNTGVATSVDILWIRLSYCLGNPWRQVKARSIVSARPSRIHLFYKDK